MHVKNIDHLVLTVKDIGKTVIFYTTVMGMKSVEFGKGRVALTFGQQKINLHQSGEEFEPHAHNVMPGSADLCFVVDTPVEQAVEELKAKGVHIFEGPVQRTGAVGIIHSIYFRDPDGNLIELSNYLDK